MSKIPQPDRQGFRDRGLSLSLQTDFLLSSCILLVFTEDKHSRFVLTEEMKLTQPLSG